MDLKQHEDGEARFAAYVEGLASVIGHPARTSPLRGLLHGFDAAR